MNIQKQVEAPFRVYADFESILKQLSGNGNKYQEHIACSYAYQIVGSVPGIEFEPRLHVGVGAADHFIDTLQGDLNKYIMPLIEKGVDMIWNDEAKTLSCMWKGTEPIGRANRARSLSLRWTISWSCTSTL